MKSLKTPCARLWPVMICLFGVILAMAQQPRSVSPIQPLKPVLPDEPLSKREKLIKLPSGYWQQNIRSRRSTDSPSPLSEEQKILHLLNRAGFGPRPGDVERVRQIGVERYIEEQLHPENLADDLLARPLTAFNTLQMSIPETIQYFAPPAKPTPAPTPAPTPTPPVTPPALASKGDSESELIKVEPGKVEMTGPQNPSQDPSDAMPRPPQLQPMPTPTPAPRRDAQQPLRELQQTKLLRAIFSEKQLQEVMVDFWFNHFNVYAGKDAARWMVTSYERDVIRPHALGKFKELLTGVAQSPAMLYYLDNFLSQVEPPMKKDADGNPILARRPGLNENYARELMELHTLGVDGGYTQQDVIEVARCFTGWTVLPQPNSAFVFRPRMHDKGEKLVLGERIPAGGGIEDGLRALDLLAKHPSTAKFISYKLSQRFVADEPPQSLVDRAAEVFRQTGGDIRQVVRTILTSPEFYSPKYYRNKIKSPLDLTASAIRAVGAATDAHLPLIIWTGQMGEPLYLCQPPTGYSEDSSRWMSNATLLERMNFAVALISNKINGTRVDVSRFVAPDTVKDKNKLLDQLIAVLIHSEVGDETRDNLSRVVNEARGKMTPAKYDERMARKNTDQLVGGLAALILGSREFQVK
jgi:uncharacterized protein (DUF1800 family)